jgi:ActR/RegA family two-component response regulator
MTATVLSRADAQAAADVLAAGHISTVYVGYEPTVTAMARDLGAHRAVLVVHGGCHSADALFAEHREARR